MTLHDAELAETKSKFKYSHHVPINMRRVNCANSTRIPYWYYEMFIENPLYTVSSLVIRLVETFSINRLVFIFNYISVHDYIFIVTICWTKFNFFPNSFDFFRSLLLLMRSPYCSAIWYLVVDRFCNFTSNVIRVKPVVENSFPRTFILTVEILKKRRWHSRY